MTDFLEVGEFYTMNYLRSSGLLNSPSIGSIFSFAPLPFLNPARSDVKKLNVDDVSPVYVVKEANTVTRTNYEYLIDKGSCFYVENVYTIGDNDTVYIAFDSVGIDKQFQSFPTAWKTSNGPILITLGICDSYSGGDEITPLNRNSKATTEAEVKYIYNPTVVGGVYPDYPTILVGSDSTRQDSGGASIAGRLPIKLNGYNYVFKIENLSGSEAYLYSDIIWFEV